MAGPNHEWGVALLDEISNRSDGASNLSERAEVIDEFDAEVTLTIDERLVGNETVSTETMPASEYRRKASSRTEYAERWDTAPSVIEAKDARFIEPTTPDACSRCGGEKKEDCPNCNGTGTTACDNCGGTTTVDCSTCGGDGYDGTCSTCGGSATVTVTTGEHQCPRCSGRSTVECPDCNEDDEECSTCGGDRVIDCPRCNGTGTEKETETQDCPDCTNGNRACSDCGGDGTLVEEREEHPTVDESSSSNLIHRRVRERSVPVRAVRYSLRDQEYVVAEVDGDIRFEDYPQSEDFLERRIDGARKTGTFSYAPPRSLKSEALAHALTAGSVLGGIVAAALYIVVAGILVSIVFGILSILVPIGETVTDATVFGSAALLLVALGGVLQTFYDSDSSDWVYSSNRGYGLLVPLLVLGAAAGFVLVRDPTQRIQATVISVAAVFWTTAVGARLNYESTAVNHALEQRRQFLEGLDTSTSELARMNLLGKLPDANPWPSAGAFHTAGLLVGGVGWGCNVLLLTLLSLSGLLQASIIELYGFNLVLGVPVATVAFATLALALVPVRAIVTDL